MAQYFIALDEFDDKKKSFPSLPHWQGALPKSAISMGTIEHADGKRPFYFFADTYEGGVSGFFTDQIFDDAEILFKSRFSRIAGDQNYYNLGPGVFFRANPLNGAEVEGYQFARGAGSTHSSIRFYDALNSSSNIGASSPTYLPNKTAAARTLEYVYCRVRFEGNNLRARAWYEGQNEPSGWGIQTTDAKYSSGRIGIKIQQHEDGGVLEFLSIGTDGDPAPSSPTGTQLPGAYGSLSGNATTAAGVPADVVAVFAWPEGARVATATPSSNGDWSAQVPPGIYGVTYISEGCQPITHGPYTVEVGAHE